MREIVSPLDGFLSPFGRISGSGGGVFSPASLFANGEEGAWFEAAPDQTWTSLGAFGGAAASTGQSVAVWLGKSKGSALGPELVANGDFATGDLTGWTEEAANTAVVTGGVLTVTSGEVRLRQAIEQEAGALYRVEFLGSGLTDFYILLRQFYSSGSLAFIDYDEFGVAYFVGTANTATFGMKVATDGASAQTGTISKVSVKKVLDLSAVQITAAARPNLQQTGGGVFYVQDDTVDDALNWTAPTDTDYTISYVDTAGNVTTLTGQSLSGATDILLDPALVGYLAVDRALTAGETTSLETYWGTLV